MHDYVGYKVNTAKLYIIKAKRILERLHVLNDKDEGDFYKLIEKCNELNTKPLSKEIHEHRSDSHNNR